MKGLHKVWYTVEMDVLKNVEAGYLSVEAVVAQSQAANEYILLEYPQALT